MAWLWSCPGEQEVYFKFSGQSSARKSEILEISVQCGAPFHDNWKNILMLGNELKLVGGTLGTHF